MDRKMLTTFLAALLSTLVQVSGVAETYRAAVVEYHPVIGVNDLDTMTKNAENYVKLIKEAHSKGADIIVFPEGGLYSKLASAIPDPVDKIAPCDSNFQTSKAVKDLSCAAKDNQIYTVINLLERRECQQDDPSCSSFYTYNTNVVFDRRGTVIARYAKYNLFESDIVTKPAEPEIVFFDTDFGVRFGTFICFDLIFWEPTLRLVQQYGITDFVFSTYWFGELPFLTGLQAQRGWAEANNVNLLASGVDVPETGSAGSGIYNGKYGHLVQIMPEKTTTKLLVADVPKIKILRSSDVTIPLKVLSQPLNKSTDIVNVHENVGKASEGGLKFLKDPRFNTYTSEIIKGGEKFERTICSTDNFCCDFKVTMDALAVQSKNYSYRAVVFNGIRPFGSKTSGGVQLCSVVVCSGPKIDDCGNREKKIPELFKFKEILIKGKFKLTNSFQMPSTLTDGEKVAPLPSNRYIFTRKEEDNSMAVSLQLVWSVVDLHTFAIWGRDFSRDNLPSVPESGAAAAVSAPVLFTAFMAFLFFVR